MSTTDTLGQGPRHAGSPGKPKQTNTLHPGRVLNTGSDALVVAGEIWQFLVKILMTVLRRPWGFWGEVRDQSFDILKMCWLPMGLANLGFGFGAPGLQGGNIFYLFGVPDRMGSFFVMASVREFAPFINGMVVAGVVGTAMTADLGARKIRDEIDAMEVLGVEPVRALIVPRVIAIVLMTALLDIYSLIIGIYGGWLANVIYMGANGAAYNASVFDLLSTTDLWASVLKCALFGLAIAVVCAYYGLKTEGGPMGVGKAVNTAVVVAFACVWVINITFTTVLIGYNPDIPVYR